MGHALRTVYSCVIDHHPKFLMQAWTWMLSLQLLGIRPSAGTRILIHHPETMAGEDCLRTLSGLGAELVPITPFGTGPAAYCNKLRQLDSPAVQAADRVVLCDADLVFVTDPALHFSDRAIRAKPVDRANPPAEQIEALFARTGLPFPGWFEPDFEPGAKTPLGNCNGGLYLIPGTLLPRLSQSWLHWARFCLEQQDLLRHRCKFSDQLGFMLALVETGLPFEPLPLAANFPTHFAGDAYAETAPLRIETFHYHGRINTDSLPATTGVNWIDRQLHPLVAAIRASRRDSFDNRLFWSHRYATDPELGSGLGSRGEVLLRKRDLLAPVLQGYAHRPVVDIGCGDLETMREARLDDYHGFDLSDEALALARAKRPDWRFSQGAAGDVPARGADLAICLDVAIHQPTADAYHALIDGVVGAARDAVLISGYEAHDDAHGIVYFHEPLSRTLAGHPAVESVTDLGGWRDVRLFLATLRRDSGNRNDIRPEALHRGLKASPTPRLLGELVDLSREMLGFFPATVIRMLEYPWFASRLTRSAGKRLLDVGAGVSVMPLWLARQGATVETVDRHPRRRDPAGRETWNEWGFLDYALLDGRIRSHHLGIEALEAEPFDAIYSVSVIEHMPAAIRCMALARMARLLLPGGRLLLSLDLVPGTDELWRLAEGKDVDPGAAHGTVDDVLSEIRAPGFTLLETTLRRAIPGSRTDLLMIEAALTP
ncbi:MAG: methyltransferase domain-containing protein [Paracoccus sp. (in: a-proteobacteria)]